jgi:hypothetical protein
MTEEDEELIELAELTAVTALHYSLTMQVSTFTRQFGWSRETALKFLELAVLADERGREMRLRLRNKCGPKPAVQLETAGGVVGKDMISYHYRMGLKGQKRNGGPWLTVDKAIGTLQNRTRYRHKKTHRADDGDNSARGRARAYLVEWLKAQHHWLRPYVDRYGFGCPLPAPTEPGGCPIQDGLKRIMREVFRG